MHFLEKNNFLENSLPGCIRLGGGGGSKSYVWQFMLAKIIHLLAKIAVRLCAPAQIGLVWICVVGAVSSRLALHTSWRSNWTAVRADSLGVDFESIVVQ